MRLAGGWVVAAVAALALTATALATQVSVAPHSARPHSRFAVRFTAPVAAGTGGAVSTTYTVDAATSQRAGCDARVSAAVRKARAGERVRVILAAPRGAKLCKGRYSGVVQEIQGPHCTGGKRCPEFPSRLRTIARFHFRVA